MKIDSVIDIKRKNVKSILDYARFRSGWQKRDAAQELDLSFATVSNIINQMLECGLLEQTEVNLKAVGRAPKGYQLVADRFVLSTMDIHTPDAVMLTLVDLQRKPVAQRVCTGLDTDSIGGFIDGLSQEYLRLLASTPYDESRVIGSVAVIPGTYDTKSQMVVGTHNRLFRDQPLLEMLEHVMHHPVSLENDANLAAFSKASEQDLHYLIYLYCGNGLGMGAVSGGQILTGANGFSVEISHAPFGNLGRKCRFCGHTDCLQEDVSPRGFVSKYLGTVIEDEAFNSAMWEDFLQALERKEPRATAAALDNAKVLGRALSTASSILRPEKIILGGLPHGLFEGMRSVMEEEINSRERHNAFIKVRFDPDFRHTTAIGGAERLYRDWFPDLDAEKLRA